MCQKMIYVSFLILPVLMLTGCSAMNTEFDCPMKPGVRCESIDKVNAKVDSGLIGADECLSCQQDQVMLPDEKISAYKDAPCGKKMNIWIAPYTDDHGNYHTASNVYASTSNKSLREV
jgi:conjugal transfer pilus assembly protein TraV